MRGIRWGNASPGHGFTQQDDRGCAAIASGCSVIRTANTEGRGAGLSATISSRQSGGRSTSLMTLAIIAEWRAEFGDVRYPGGGRALLRPRHSSSIRRAGPAMVSGSAAAAVVSATATRVLLIIVSPCNGPCGQPPCRGDYRSRSVKNTSSLWNRRSVVRAHPTVPVETITYRWFSASIFPRILNWEYDGKTRKRKALKLLAHQRADLAPPAAHQDAMSMQAATRDSTG